MGPDPLVYSSSPPKFLALGMKVVIPGTTALYLKKCGCRVLEKHMNCVAEAKRNNAVAMWGIVFKKIATFTVMVDTSNGEPLCPETPMFIGLGEAGGCYLRFCRNASGAMYFRGGQYRFSLQRFLAGSKAQLTESFSVWLPAWLDHHHRSRHRVGGCHYTT
ncbi:hypothetical protein C3747_170g56 [Trypanosoma cruzi]|uniref:Uncharacterized protein n=1 Tax=Trypanosoma cruzi TaxID=5693 RepID=A0A2V2W512_TRYCR|nr:hypothetical protein C3747_170g56 [Trypanosoma cruzi]